MSRDMAGSSLFEWGCYRETNTFRILRSARIAFDSRSCLAADCSASECFSGLLWSLGGSCLSRLRVCACLDLWSRLSMLRTSREALGFWSSSARIRAFVKQCYRRGVFFPARSDWLVAAVGAESAEGLIQRGINLRLKRIQSHLPRKVSE